MNVRIHEQYGPEGAVVWGITTRERPEQVRSYTESLGIDFPVLLDRDGSVDQLYALQFPFPTGAYPQDYVVGSDGRIVYASNEPDVEAIEDAVARELAEE